MNKDDIVYWKSFSSPGEWYPVYGIIVKSLFPKTKVIVKTQLGNLQEMSHSELTKEKDLPIINYYKEKFKEK